MTTPATPTANSALRGAPLPIGWRSWPIVEGGSQVWLFLAVAAGVGIAVGTVTESSGWAAAAVILVSVASWRFFVPVVYEVSALGVAQHVLGWRRRAPWTSIDRLEIGREGVFMSLEGAPLASLRGLYLPWGSHRTEVLSNVAYYVPSSRISGGLGAQPPAESATGSTLHRLPADPAESQGNGPQGREFSASDAEKPASN